ncbi:unnamed protein product [Parnassius apollo]|uniref:(apollo) hypothetical protein n=1 Tax=Parnassius apollo TaxID=110799 RepID=A0A8S3WA63_PARAO|nr:unnamed protein product [Parnassius apollo]
MKLDMKNTFGDGLYISNLHLIPDPLKKNLADSIITEEVKTKTTMASEIKTLPNVKKRNEVEASEHRIDYYPSLAGITSFFSGVFSFMSGAMFHKRANSPTEYYECFEQNFDEMTPSLQAWQHAKSEDQNKNGRAHNVTASTNDPTNTHSLTMDLNCKINAARCEDKLNQVRLLLSNHQTPQYQLRLRPRRPRKVFVEPNSIEDCFEDAFSPEDIETFPNDTILEYYSPFSYQNPELLVSDAPQIKTKYLPVTEQMETCNTLPDIDEDNSIDISTNNGKNVNIVSSCEDKINALKALLDKRQNPKSTTDHNSAILTEPTQKEQKSQPITILDNYTDRIISSAENKKQNSTLEGDKTFNQFFVEDIVKDINSSDLNNSFESQDDQCSDSSPEYLDPSNYFDEVTGRFYSTSATDSEDSFQIVFTDSPRSLKNGNLSDCDSEDSFIVFEDSPDSCYLSNDVFGDELSSQEVAIYSSDFDNSDESDNSDSESDSGCDYHPTCKLSHSLTRTIGDLTDDSLYEVDENKGDKDEVDCSPKFTVEKPVENVTKVIEKNEVADAIKTKPRGLLIDEKRKLDKKKQPAKNQLSTFEIYGIRPQYTTI